MQRNSPAALARLAENTRIRQRLGLTPAQVTKIEGYAFDWRKDQINARAQEQIAQLELHQLRQATTPDEPAIDQKLTAISGLRLGMAKSDVHYRLAMRSVLTPAQQQQARAWMHRRGSMHPMEGRMRGMDRRSMEAPRMERHGSGSGSGSTAS